MVFDTETNGLIPKNVTYHNSNSFPYILQLSYIIYTYDTNKILCIEDDIVKIPINVNIPEEVTNINKITKSITEEKGIPIRDILEKFIFNLSRISVLVAHNYNFDKNMLLAELKRNNMLTNNIQKLFLKGYCTMQNSIQLCKIPKGYHNYNNSSFKFPKLIELYYYLFIKNNNNPMYLDQRKLHNSLCDVIVTLRCYFKMNYKIDIYESSQEYKKLFDKNVLLW